MKILVTGGGSGGHITPALAVAQRLVNEGHNLLYVGGTMVMEGSSGKSLEQQLVEPTGIPFTAIASGKLRRGGLSFKTITRLWGVVPGMWQAYKVVRSFSPQVVFSSGGYISLPVVVAAWLQRVPVVIHEQTAAVGLANSWAGKLATKIAITFPQSASYFPARKVVLTGNPMRPEITHPASLQPDHPLSVWLTSQTKPLLYVTGGGLGSHVLNVAIEEHLERFLEQFCVVHQCGSHQGNRDLERLQQKAATLDSSLRAGYWPAEHFSASEVGILYQQASVVIARAGANTVLELAYWGVPAVFVPIPWVTHDEQTKNAQILEEAGTAVILPETSLSGSNLLSSVTQVKARVTQNPQSVIQAKAVVQPDALTNLVAIILSTAP